MAKQKIKPNTVILPTREKNLIDMMTKSDQKELLRSLEELDRKGLKNLKVKIGKLKKSIYEKN